ncbi:hypothetical protein BGZ63DRAFT_37421 [Mariannaea sp. PMI_226]|nr:hypothetical protein BGZ63DRAFT_37421 [Mariannaea sp. PMI_226]
MEPTLTKLERTCFFFLPLGFASGSKWSSGSRISNGISILTPTKKSGLVRSLAFGGGHHHPNSPKRNLCTSLCRHLEPVYCYCICLHLALLMYFGQSTRGLKPGSFSQVRNDSPIEPVCGPSASMSGPSRGLMRDDPDQALLHSTPVNTHTHNTHTHLDVV